MNKRKLMIVLTFLVMMMAATTLTRCGSGLGKQVEGTANGMKI